MHPYRSRAASVLAALKTLAAPCLLACLLACQAPPGKVAPSDDPADYAVTDVHGATLRLGTPRWLIPSTSVPLEITPDRANNNVDIVYHGDRLYLAWRSAPSHFASARAALHVISSADDGSSWVHEASFTVGADLREPRWLSLGARLHLYYFEGGQVATAFEPRRMWRTERLDLGRFSAPVTWGEPGEVPWTVKARAGVAYLASYRGNHYGAGDSDVAVLFRRSTDGVSWQPVDPARPVVYRGGASEAAFELDVDGGLWAVLRVEDGDASGFGSHVCRAEPGRLAHWVCGSRTDPERYDSPTLFRYADTLYLIARRDLGGPYDQGLPGSPSEVRTTYQLAYWQRPKRTALYRLDRQRRAVVHVLDLPSAGDTAFPAIRRRGPHSFLVANYSSALDQPQISWLRGQGEPTSIYVMDLRFEAGN